MKDDKDGGLAWALQVRPTNSCFKSWMDFAFLLTVSYNRTRNQRHYTILRNEYFLLELCFNQLYILAYILLVGVVWAFPSNEGIVSFSENSWPEWVSSYLRRT